MWREKALASAGHVYSLNIPEKLIYKTKVLQMLLAVPFVEIGEKQKITIASICDKKENLQKRSPKIARCEVTHNFSFSHGANLLHPGF